MMENTCFKDNGLTNFNNSSKKVLQVFFPENISSTLTKFQTDEPMLKKSSSTDSINSELNLYNIFLPEVIQVFS